MKTTELIQAYEQIKQFIAFLEKEKKGMEN